MKILFLNIGLYMGGAERQICDLADSYVGQGHEVQIVAILDTQATVRPISNKVSIHMLGHAFDKSQSASILFRSFGQIRKIIKEFKPDVVHANMFHSNILSRLLRLCTPMPCLINTVHSNNEGGKLRMFLYRVTDRLVDITTNVSKDATDNYYKKKAVPKGRMITINNGINTDKFKPSTKESILALKATLGLVEHDFMLLAVGRLSIPKDYHTMFEAFADLKNLLQGRSIKLFIAGSGPLEEELKAKIKQLNLENDIKFLGVRRDTVDLMSAANLYIMSSAWEGLPLVIGEAMSCEKFIVSTDAGGVKEWLGDTGIVVPIKKSQLLAKACQQAILMSEIDREIIGKRARERIIENYSIKSVANIWLELYGKYLKK